MGLAVNVNNENLLLKPHGAIYWQNKQTLLIADVHLGKVSHFRKHGSAVPAHLINKNFINLDKTIKAHKVNKILFLGDLFHSFSNSEWDYFAHWRMKYKQEIILIVGNHDIIDAQKYQALGIKVVEDITLPPFYFTHYPNNDTDLINVAGHLHPGVKLKGYRKMSITSPCFYFSKKQIILPAFGVFTGKYIITPSADDKIYALANEEVIEVTSLFQKK